MVKVTHDYQSENGYLICRKCGATDNLKPYHGFRYWLKGIGYHSEPDCNNY